MADEHGFRDIMEFSSLKPGDKVYFVNREKSMYLAIIGEESVENGIHIIGSHVDSPRLDLKPNPLCEEGGLAYFKINTEGKVSTKDLLVFNVFAILGCAIAWVVVAPVLDIVIYGEPVNLVFVQGGIAFVMDAIVSCVIGSILLLTYSSTRSSKGSLTKE